MEKGFNDDELADIMNEIENLEQEFTHEEVIDEQPHLDEVAESVAQMAKEEESEHEVFQEVVKMPVEDVIPLNTERESHMKTTHKVTNTQSNTAMNFSVEGDMKLDMSFLVNGSEVKLHISDDGFEIEMEGGAKFTLPVHQHKSGSQAA